MPIKFSIVKDQKLVISTFTGDVNDSELLTSYDRLINNQEFMIVENEVADMRNAQMTRVSATALFSLSKLVQDHLNKQKKPFKTAVIAPKSLPYGLSRQYEMYSEKSPESVRVFKTLNEAYKWLELEDSTLD